MTCTPLELIVRFLAVLELFKQGVVELDQAGNFGEIEITWLGDDDLDDVFTRDKLLIEAESYD
jgi:segregation and condensation protein A